MRKLSADDMAEFDIISKQLFKEFTDDFVRFALNRKRVQVLEVIDTELPTVESRRTDVLARVRIGGREVLVHIEFQTGDSTDVPMPRRMSGYIGRLIEELGLPVCAIVIYLRPNAGRNDPGKYEYRLGDFRFAASYRVLRLIEIDGEQIVQQKLWGLLPFAPLMKSPEGIPSENWLRQCVQAVDEVPLDEISKVNFLTEMSILSGLVYDFQTIFNIISEETMYESSIVQHFTERGIEQGIEQGQKQQSIESVLDILGMRFDPSAAETLKSIIETIEDLQSFKQLLRSAVQVTDLDEFKQTLDSMTNGK